MPEIKYFTEEKAVENEPSDFIDIKSPSFSKHLAMLYGILRVNFLIIFSYLNFKFYQNFQVPGRKLCTLFFISLVNAVFF